MTRALTAIAALACLIPAAAPAAQATPAPTAPAATTGPTAPAATGAPAVPAAPAAFTLDSPIETLVADPRARAVIDRNLPTLRGHPSYDMFKASSLRQLQPFSQGALTDELMTRIQAELAAVR